MVTMEQLADNESLVGFKPVIKNVNSVLCACMYVYAGRKLAPCI